ncbi:huntingtin interacting protein 1 related b [Lates japonicus]|uniref:Huntingtin interacting protein 1 related b n=1 Tax=Lates japonicus TaxID=270547 RepID=A0AAD3R3R3_LATJO|nr:huntingtin interacting protein 1 related b [Lates japonicus]
MNSIRQVPTRVKSRRTEANLGAEKEHFDKQQLSSIIKPSTPLSLPVKGLCKRATSMTNPRTTGALYTRLLYTKLEFHVKSPPNFLHAASLAKPREAVVVIPARMNQSNRAAATASGPLIEVSDVSASGLQMQLQRPVCVNAAVTVGFVRQGSPDREPGRDLELLRAELDRVKQETARVEWRSHTCLQKREHDLQTTFIEAEKKAQATEQRYNKLKEKHTELVASHAELLRKSADTVKMLSVTQQTQERREVANEQLNDAHGQRGRLMRSVAKEAELSSLRQAAGAAVVHFNRRRDRSSRGCREAATTTGRTDGELQRLYLKSAEGPEVQDHPPEGRPSLIRVVRSHLGQDLRPKGMDVPITG